MHYLRIRELSDDIQTVLNPNTMDLQISELDARIDHPSPSAAAA